MDPHMISCNLPSRRSVYTTAMLNFSTLALLSADLARIQNEINSMIDMLKSDD